MPTAETTLVHLPGQAQEDAGLIDETVAALNTIVERGGLATMRELARVVLDKMFRDDSDQFLHAEQSHASYRALLRHPDLRVSKSGLWYAVAVHRALQRLGSAGAQLSTSHLKRLVHVADDGARATLAAEAAGQGWSVEELEVAIAAREAPRPADAPRLGRPPLPLPVKRLAKVERAVVALAQEAGAAELDAEAARELLGRAEAAQRALAAWVEGLRARAGG
jgi:hypothetical protein